MELTEKEAHCIARLLQNGLFCDNESIYNGCYYCKFRFEDKNPTEQIKSVLKKIEDETGVDLKIENVEEEYLPHSNIPYKKFLAAANEKTKDGFRKFFADV